MDQVNTGEASQLAPCASCGCFLGAQSRYCGSCGQMICASVAPASPVSGNGSEVGVLISFYGIALLVVVAWTIYENVQGSEFLSSIGVTSCIGVLVLIYAAIHRQNLRGLLTHRGFRWRGYGLILLASILILALVHAYVHGLQWLFGVRFPGELQSFEGRSSVWPLLFLVVLPPITEELAFRGLIFNGLRRSMTLSEAFMVSSFAFALLHLSIPSLITHLPLGLYFCWLRYRSGSLWPPIFAHACHNAGVWILCAV